MARQCWSSVTCFLGPAHTAAPTATVAPTPQPSHCGLALSPPPELRARYRLFGRLRHDACAWALEFGNVPTPSECAPVFAAHPAFLSTAEGGVFHRGWWQVIAARGAPLLNILYRFDDAQTLEGRFSSLARGVPEKGVFEVNWSRQQ